MTPFLFLVLAVMALAAAALVVRPLLARAAAPAGEAANADFEADLAAIERARATGDMDGEAADTALAEAQRRFLGKPAAAAAAAIASRARPAAAGALAALLIAGAGGLYALTRNPDHPIAADEPSSAQRAELEAAIAKARERVREQPTSAPDWNLLGWMLYIDSRFEESLAAYQRAIALEPRVAAHRSGYGETLVGAADGVVTPEARNAFQAALERDPKDMRGRFFLGLAKAQAGQAKAAIADWFAIYQEIPAASDASREMRQRIEELAAQSKIDVANLFPPEPRANERRPSAADVEAAAQLSPQEREAMIEQMVQALDARLRQNPRDLEGWMKLINARFVQGKMAEAHAAIARARAAFKGDAEALRQLDQAEAAIGPP